VNTFGPAAPDRGTAAAVECFIHDRGKWECWEFMLKCNTPGEHDGEQEMWIDGRKIGHFTKILWRDNADVKANCLWLMHYGFDSSDPTKGTWKQSQGAAMRDTVWFDDVVVSTEYIGPKKQ